jgi:hydrogenase maturation protease
VNTLLVIGVGNLDRGDDGAGIAAARLIRAAAPHVRVIESAGDAADLIDLWQSAETVYVIDAMLSGAPPGTVQRFDAQRRPLPVRLGSTSSHAFGVGAAVELARILGYLPPRLIVYGIEGAQYDMGSGLSQPTAAAVNAIVADICLEIERARS